jgi:hypothetical protein
MACWQCLLYAPFAAHSVGDDITGSLCGAQMRDRFSTVCGCFEVAAFKRECKARSA